MYRSVYVCSPESIYVFLRLSCSIHIVDKDVMNAYFLFSMQSSLFD